MKSRCGCWRETTREKWIKGEREEGGGEREKGDRQTDNQEKKKDRKTLQTFGNSETRKTNQTVTYIKKTANNRN